MPREIVLRILRSDVVEGYVLLNVIANGPSPLDLKLIATEGEAAYVGSVRQKALRTIRTRNYHGNDEEWNDIVSLVLLRERLDGSKAEATSAVETVASIAGNILSITLRKNIEGITQRLGVITLKEHEAQDDEEEPPVQLFDWAGVAVATSAALETEVASLSANLHAQQERLTKLNGQLEDLIKAREEHENLLLEKFMELLNAKKLKIRDQQRLLAEAKIDPNKAAWIKSARGSTKSRKPASSGANKRKAEAEANEAASESDEGFEKMDIVDDNGAEVELIEQERESTPDKSDVDATDDEEDSILDSVAAPRSKYSGLNSTTKASATETAKTPGTQIKTASPPPPRELPFIRKPGVAEVANNDDEVETEGETDDDEL